MTDRSDQEPRRCPRRLELLCGLPEAAGRRSIPGPGNRSFGLGRLRGTGLQFSSPRVTVKYHDGNTKVNMTAFSRDRFDRHARDGRVRVLSLLVVASVLLASAPTGVSAYANQVYPACISDPLAFDPIQIDPTDVVWSGARITLLQAGATQLSSELDFSGNQLVDVHRYNAAADPIGDRWQLAIRDLFDPATGDDPFALTFRCGQIIHFDSNSALSDSQMFKRIFQHEALHGLGGLHAGREDSRNNNGGDDGIPALATCLNDPESTSLLRHDDAAYLNFLHNPILYEQMTANGGLENGTKYWSGKNGSLTHIPTGGELGPGYLSFTASGTATNSYVYQNVLLWHGTLGPRRYRTIYQVSESQSQNVTLTRPKLFARAVLQNPNPPVDPCSYVPGVLEPNNPTIVGGFVKLVEGPFTNVFGTNWDARTTAWRKTIHKPDLQNADGFEFQIRVYGKATSGGSSVPIRFDDMRGERR